MTIKKRLFLSNLLMVVIPAIVSAVTVWVALMVVLQLFFGGMVYEVASSRQMGIARLAVVELAEELLASGDLAGQAERAAGLEETLDHNGMVLWVKEEGREIYRLGSSPVWSESTLVEAINALGGEGQVSSGGAELFAKTIPQADKVYTLFVYNPQLPTAAGGVGAPLVLLVSLVAVGFILILFLTNRFLTRFVFRRIQQPLEVLSDGVRQIGGGNLEHRIVYDVEDEFGPICEDFNQMAARLKDSVELAQRNEQNRKELLAGISHDLRSPLTSIKAYVQGLQDGIAKTPEAQQEYLQTIQTKTDDINNMVAKLFLFSKMDMGEYPNAPELLDLGGELSEFVEAAREDYLEKGLAIRLLRFSTARRVWADPIQLRSVFANILDNSAKYREKPTGLCTIRCEADGQMLRIVFEDDGPGVPEEALPKLFHVFYRSDPSRRNPHTGSGLGLAIAAKALERMEGRIRGENRASGGLRMIVEIPERKGGNPNEENPDY